LEVKLKPVPNEFIAWVASAHQILVGELYTLQLVNGVQLSYTNLDFDVLYEGTTFSARSIRFDGMKFKLQVGIAVDEQEIKASSYPPPEEVFPTGSDNFFLACQNGSLDGALFVRQRAFWEVNDGRPWVDYAATPKAVITIFTGYVSEMTKIGRTSAQIKVKSPLKYLDIQLPRNTFQASCNWTLYDQGCTLTRTAYTTAFAVLEVVDNIVIAIDGTLGTGGDGNPDYMQGRLRFTSGVLNGFQTLIATNSVSAFQLQYPLTQTPAVGDTFLASLGCVKTLNTCDAKFGNKKNFRGFPFVPPVHISL
jgi:hypothetical protein